MEISKIGSGAVKIKGKNSSLVIDPASKVDAEVVIATQSEESLALDKVAGLRLVISGPGEYEVGGISVSAKKVKDEEVLYTFTDSSRIVFVPSSALESVPDDENFDAVLIKVVSPFSDDALAPLNAKCFVLWGDTALATIKSENKEQATRINLRKAADIQGKIFLLG